MTAHLIEPDHWSAVSLISSAANAIARHNLYYNYCNVHASCIDMSINAYINSAAILVL